jgi:hypothetical protein
MVGICEHPFSMRPLRLENEEFHHIQHRERKDVTDNLI